MQVVTPELVKDKKVLLRLDIDVPIGKSSDVSRQTSDKDKLMVLDDFRLVAGMPTLELCLEHAQKVIILGHIDRPGGKKVEELSVAPVYDWLVSHGFEDEFDSGKLQLLENLRFEKGEEEASVYYAKELAALGNFYVNEAFASHHKAASTTVLPMLLPHAVGLRFFKEVEVLRGIRENSQKPLVAVIGGVKIEDKLPAVLSMSKIADYVLVGGKIAGELKKSYAGDRWGAPAPVTPHLSPAELPENILLAELNEEGTDITEETIEKWAPIIASARTILWNGPLGKIENSKFEIRNSKMEELGNAKGTYKIAQMIIKSDARSIVGGGDTVGFLDKIGLLDKFEQKGFVSTGGGAMLKFLETGTLSTIEALK